ncbi:MAG: 3'-5' exonuclease [Bradymonadaceae bacterium]|nr:3'-5' exonuclease [Lujinxingiaceae bacterium]
MSKWPTLWKDLPLAVIDVETTGLDPLGDRVIEIGIIRFEHGEVVETYGQLINPERSIPDESVKITGITDADVQDKPTFAEVAGEIHARLQDVGLVAYNLSFDRSFVRHELERCGLNWPEEAPTLDPLIFARQFFKNHPRKNLGTVSKLLGIPLEEAHRATHDATVAGRVLFAFADRLPEDLAQLLLLQAQWEAAQASEMSGWRNNRDGAFDSLSDALGEQPIGLGPAYIYGDEADPLRALYMSVPEATD